MLRAIYVRHSSTRVQNACPGCGNADLYFAHEQRGVPSSADPMYCRYCTAAGPLILVDASMQPHDCPSVRITIVDGVTGEGRDITALLHPPRLAAQTER